MIKNAVAIITIFTFLFGCDFSKHVKDSVDNGVKDAKTEMNSDINNAISSFTETYNKVLKQSTDTGISAKILRLASSMVRRQDTLTVYGPRSINLITWI